VYEVAFAKRELTGLGAKVHSRLEDTIRFEIEPPCDINKLAKRTAHFQSIGNQKTEYSWVVSHNQKGSDNQFLTHWYYPYKGKYHPRLVRSIFNIIGLEYGETVLDPFIGSGTTGLEAHLFGLDFRGFDISPVCVIVSKVKVTAGEVAEKLPLFKKDALKFMHKDFTNSLKQTKEYKKLVEESEKSAYKEFLDSIDDERIKNFYLLAQLIFASDRERRRRDFRSFEKNLDAMIASAIQLAEVEDKLAKDRSLGKAQIDRADARNLKSIKNESIDGIITSPPYSIALNYIENDKHALAVLNEDVNDLSKKCIGVKGKGKQKVALYEEDMYKCYDEMYRVLKQGRQCVVVIGEATIDGECTQNVEDAINHCESTGFKLKENLSKKIFGLYNTIKDERVLFFEKQ
jgi:DNA modification methylase